MSWNNLRDSTPKARKPYWCLVCGNGILVGEKYFSRTGTDTDYPGEINTFRMHLECEVLTRTWTIDDWEIHYPGDVKRPTKEDPS